MIVAAGERSQQGHVLIVGLTEADVAEMRKGLTKTKQGNPQYGFHSMIVFMGKSDKEMLELLSQAGTVRNDDIFPTAGQG